MVSLIIAIFANIMFSLIAAIIVANMYKNKLYFLQSKGGFYITFFLLWILFAVNPVFIFFAIFFGQKMGTSSQNKRNNQNGNNPFYNSFSQGRHSSYNTAPNASYKRSKNPSNISNPYELPKREGGRKKIISRFNSRYGLNLTSQDIHTMASGTYMSIEWASEVYSMNQKYNSLYEWFGQGNSWLRVYLYVFNIQTISPVFNKQEEIVFQSFDTIFSEMCVDDDLPTEVIIQNINNKFLTNFDEPTFMLAINYMESKGKRYKYGSPILTRMHSDIDDLARKYTTTP